MLFSKKEDAEKLCEAIHKWLQENCKDYMAVRWQEPEYDGKNLYMVKLPQEYDNKELYTPKEDITESLNKETSLCDSVSVKLPQSFEVNRALLSGKNGGLPK